MLFVINRSRVALFASGDIPPKGGQGIHVSDVVVHRAFDAADSRHATILRTLPKDQRFPGDAVRSEEFHSSFDVLEKLAVSDIFSVFLDRVDREKRQDFVQKKRRGLMKEIRHLGKWDVLPARQILSVSPHDIGERYSANVDLPRLDKNAQEIYRPGEGLDGNKKIRFFSCGRRRIRHEVVPQAPLNREHRQGDHRLR